MPYMPNIIIFGILLLTERAVIRVKTPALSISLDVMLFIGGQLSVAS